VTRAPLRVWPQTTPRRRASRPTALRGQQGGGHPLLPPRRRERGAYPPLPSIRLGPYEDPRRLIPALIVPGCAQAGALADRRRARLRPVDDVVEAYCSRRPHARAGSRLQRRTGVQPPSGAARSPAASWASRPSHAGHDGRRGWVRLLGQRPSKIRPISVAAARNVRGGLARTAAWLSEDSRLRHYEEWPAQRRGRRVGSRGVAPRRHLRIAGARARRGGCPEDERGGEAAGGRRGGARRRRGSRDRRGIPDLRPLPLARDRTWTWRSGYRPGDRPSDGSSSPPWP